MAAIVRLMFVIALVAVMVVALWPQTSPSPLSTGWDKADHVAAFIVLGLLGLASWPPHRWRVVVGLLIYGAAIEALQSLTVYRQAEWRDLVADAVGVGVALLVFAWWRGRRRAFP